MSLTRSLRNLIRRHRRLLKFALLSGGLFALGFALLYTSVTYLNVSRVWANALLSLPMGLAAFTVHRLVTWGDRKAKLGESLPRYGVLRLCGSAVSQSSYIALVGYGFHYLGVRVALGILIGIPMYYLQDKVVFPAERLGWDKFRASFSKLVIRPWRPRAAEDA